MVLYYVYILMKFSKIYILFTKLNHKKRYSVRHPSAQVRLPLTGPLLPPHLYLHYTTWGKHYPAAEKLCGGRINIRRPNNYRWRARMGQKLEKKITQCRKLSHSGETTLFQILIHCERSSAENRTLSPILIHYQSYTLS